MKFTTPCFIRKNTPELRQKLEELGRDYNCNLSSIPDPDTIVCGQYEDSDKHYYCPCNWKDLIGRPNDLGHKMQYSSEEKYIDTGTNESLFLALSALRGDSDYMQWFVLDEYNFWYLCKERKFRHFYVEWEEGEADIRACFRKATPAELISHFTEKGGERKAG